MRNLLNFLWKNYAIFLFLILETIAFSMVMSSGHQGAVFSYASNQWGGKAFSSYQSIHQYFKLSETNEQLVAENIYLRSQLKQSYLKRDYNSFDDIVIKSDTIKPDSIVFYYDTTSLTFEYINATVISNSVNKQQNYLMLNKGYQQGIRENMGVISSQGGVGIVYAVSDDFCTIISLLNTKTNISAKLYSSNELGNLKWDGRNPQIAHLTSIETYIPIHTGDSVVSSGFSHIFPEGVLLGTIKDFYIEASENTYTIEVLLSTKFSQLNQVTIIRNRFYEEQIELERRKAYVP